MSGLTQESLDRTVRHIREGVISEGRDVLGRLKQLLQLGGSYQRGMALCKMALGMGLVRET